MPIQRRLPKIGFTSAKKRLTSEVRLGELMSLEAEVITLDVLISADIVPIFTKRVKVILSGKINKAVKLDGLVVTPGAKVAIEAAGGSIA